MKVGLSIEVLQCLFNGLGCIEVDGNIDELDGNCGEIDYLGDPQKKVILTDEITNSPYYFKQFFSSGGTVIRANFKIEKQSPTLSQSHN